ncbi:hypothetical protein ACER0C_016514 [Sarotherodon galilaeus]
MDPADSIWYRRPAVSAFLRESVRQEAKHAQELQSPFYGSRLAFGGPRSLQTAMATAEPAPMPRKIRLSTCSFSPVTTPPPPPPDFQSDKKVKRQRKKDYVTPDVRLTPLQSFALFLGLQRSELHKLSDSSLQPGSLEDLQPSLPPPTSRRRRRSHRHHSFSAGQLPVVSYNDCFRSSELGKDNQVNTVNSETVKTVKTVRRGGGRKLKNIVEESVFAEPAPSPRCVPAPRAARAQHSPAPVSMLQVREAEVQLVPAPVPVAAPVLSPRVEEAGIRQVPAPVSDLAGGSGEPVQRFSSGSGGSGELTQLTANPPPNPPLLPSLQHATTCGSNAVAWSSYGYGFVLAWSSYGFVLAWSSYGFVLAWSSYGFVLAWSSYGFVLAWSSYGFSSAIVWSSYGFSSAIVWSSFSVACSVTLARFAWSCLGHADVRTTSCASTAPASFQASDYASWSCSACSACSACPACSSCTSCPACSSFLAAFQADDWASSPSWTASFRADDWASSPSWTAS